MHQLRYLAAYGGASGAALGNQGHAYLGTTGAAVVFLAVCVLLGGLVSAALRSPRAAARRIHSSALRSFPMP